MLLRGEVRGRIWIDGQPPWFFTRELTEEDIGMSPRDSLRGLLGDGNARVTVSMEMRDTDYGTGFGTHVSVALTCDQEESSVREAASIATGLAEEFVEEAFDTARELFDQTPTKGSN